MDDRQARQADHGADCPFRAVFEASPDVLVVVDPATRQILEVNRAVRPVLGHAREDLVGQPVSVLLSGAGGEAPIVYGAALSGEQALRADGSVCPVDVTMAVVPWGESTAIVVSLRDVTERRQAEALLEEARRDLERSRDDLRSLLDQLRLGTVMTDPAGRVTFLSQAAEALFGTTLAAARGRPWSEVCALEPRDLARLGAVLGRPGAERARTPVVVEKPDGRRFWTEVDVREDPRDPSRTILYFYDVSELHDLRRQLDRRATLHELVGRSPAMLRLFQQIRDVAAVDTTVLIEGETGTGKELVARAIHFSGPRKDGPYVAVNCAGLTESLLASQLFGHRRGAFTGAIADQQGLFEAANGGTLFLDEIGDVPLGVQVNLLRVLEEREIVRLGDATPRKIDVRVLAATHHDLAADVARERFRADLLYRLRVARIHVPALRERREDIPLLVSHFLTQLRARTGKPVEGVTPAAMPLLLAAPWEGNVRELKSALEFAVIHARGSVIDADDLPPELTRRGPAAPAVADDTEEARIRAALAEARGNRTRAARILGIGRATLYRRLADLPEPLPPRRRRRGPA